MDYKHITVNKRDLGPYPVKIGKARDPKRYVCKRPNERRGNDG